MRADAAGRAYGQRPAAVLGLVGVLPDLVLRMVDLAAHELGRRKLSEAKALPTVDLGEM